MPSPLVLKLARNASLLADDIRLLEGLAVNSQHHDPRVDLITEGDNPAHVRLVLEGVACRYKLLRGGRRAIVAYLLPGDFCDLQVTILGEMDHSIATITPCVVAEIPGQKIRDLMAASPRIARALWWATLVDEGTLREWLVNLGQRRGPVQMAHLFCELLWRLQLVNMASEDSFVLPMTQQELSDTLGMSSVHGNRVLQQLREQGLVSLQGRRLRIPDLGRLQEFAEFNPNYLHMTPKTDAIPEND
jgi:CRP-like cAMP-binding protein